MKQVIRLIEKPNAIAIEQVLKTSRLQHKVQVIDSCTVEVEVEVAEVEFFNQLISEYCLFLLMDQYLRQQHQFMEISTHYYEEVLEEILQDSGLKRTVLTEFEKLLAEPFEGEVQVLKLAPFRNFQLKDVYYDLDDWFVMRGRVEQKPKEKPQEVMEIPFQTPEDFQEALREYYTEIEFEDEIKAFRSLLLEVGQETIYLENLNRDVFSLESLLDYVGITITLNQEAIDKAENPELMRLLVLTKSILGVLDVKLIELYRKDEAFLSALLKEIAEMDLQLEVRWRD